MIKRVFWVALGATVGIVVVNRAAKQAMNLDELYALVAKEIDVEESRKRFLATRRKLSSS